VAALRKERLLFGLFLLVLIVVIELFLHHFALPAWPAFLVMIFFFEAHMDRRRAPHLLLGGLVGILCYVLTVEFVGAAGPLLGVEVARLVFICLVVYAIVALGEVLPAIFNNYAFTFFLVSGLAARAGQGGPQLWMWIGVELVGGAAVILGVLLIGRLLASMPNSAVTKETASIAQVRVSTVGQQVE